MLKRSAASQHANERGELRKFGFVFAIVLLILFDLLLPWLKHRMPPSWPLYLAVPCVLAAMVCPRVLHWPYRVWLQFGEIAGFINTRIILGMAFFVLLTPLAWLLRLRGRDSLARRFDPGANSYRTVSAVADNADMEKPY